ncbi:MAG: hypothetical protein WA432_01650 [Candidatus Babeliaceae bacterium]
MLWWGLPISLASAAGNLLFNPLLILFLLFSSLIFFCALCGIPHSFLICILEYLTRFWLYTSSYASPAWLSGCPCPSIFICASIIFITLIITHTTFLKTLVKKCCALALFFVIAWQSITWLYIPQQAQLSINCGKKALSLVVCNNETFLINNHILSSKINMQSWIEYTLIPFLTKKTGKLVFDAFISTTLSPGILGCAELLILNKAVKKIFLPQPFFKNKLLLQPLIEKMKQYPECIWYANDTQLPAYITAALNDCRHETKSMLC